MTPNQTYAFIGSLTIVGVVGATVIWWAGTGAGARAAASEMSKGQAQVFRESLSLVSEKAMNKAQELGLCLATTSNATREVASLQTKLKDVTGQRNEAWRQLRGPQLPVDSRAVVNGVDRMAHDYENVKTDLHRHYARTR